MGEVIEFPSNKIKFEKLLDESIKRASSDNPVLAQKLREEINELHTYFKTLSSAIPIFSFTSTGGSIKDIEAPLKASVLKLTDEYNSIIKDLFSQVAVLRIENCKLKYE